MTIIDQKQVLAGLGGVERGVIFAEAREREAPPEQGTLGILKDAFLQENLAVNMFLGVFGEVGPGPGGGLDNTYNAYDDDPELAYANTDFADQFAISASHEESVQIANEIAIEQARRQRLSRAGATGFIATMAAGFLSPENLLPVAAVRRVAVAGKTLHGLSRVRQAAVLGRGGFVGGAATAGLAGLVQESVAQAGLGLLQRTRTTEEQVGSIIGAALFSGMVGGTVGAFTDTRTGLRQIVSDEYLNGPTGGRTSEVLDSADFRGLSDDAYKDRLVQALIADNHGELAARIASPKTSFLGRLWRKGSRWSPQLRLETSRIPLFQRLVKRVTDNPTFKNSDLKLGDDVGPNVEAAIVRHYGEVADTVLRIKDIYTGAKQKGIRMPQKDFRKAVSQAMRRGDKAPDHIVDSGARDAIEQAAGLARARLNFYADGAEAVGLLAKRDLKGTAESYLTRVWDREKVLTSRKDLKDILTKHFSENKNLSEDAALAADKAINSILGSRTGSTYIPPGVVGEAGPFRERLILVPDELLEKFLENDIVEILNRVTADVAPQIELAKALRTATRSMDTLPARVQTATKRAETTGDRQELEDLLEDTANLRAASALAAQFTEDGVAKARQIEKLVQDVPELRTHFRELDKRHSSHRSQIDAYEGAGRERAEIEKEVRGSHFNSLPKSVRKAFEEEIVGEKLAAPKRAVAAAEEAVGESKRKVGDLARKEKRVKERRRRALKAGDDARLVEVDADLRRTSAELKTARAERGKKALALKETQKSFNKQRRELVRSDETRGKFFEAWRRWVEKRTETSLPGTRKALGRFAKAPQASDLRKAGTRYMVAQRTFEAVRTTIIRTKNNAARLAKEKATAKGGLDHTLTALRALREEAEKTDKGVPIALRPSEGSLDDLIRKVQNGVGDARRKDALRAVRMEGVIAQGERDFAKLQDQPGANTKRLQKELENEVKDIEVIRDRLLNRAGLERGDPHHWAFQAERSFRRLNFMTMMGGVMLSSIPDLGMSVMVNGLRPTLRAWRIALKQPLREIQNQLKLNPTKTLEGLSQREELVRFSVALELADGARVKSLGDIGDTVAVSGRVEAGIEKASDVFAKAILINRWNAYHKGIATLGVMNRLLDDIGDLAAGKQLSRSQLQNLEISGINKKAALQIHEQFQKHGTREGDTSVLGVKLRGQNLPRTQAWDADAFRAKEAFQNAVISDVRRTIITPSAGDLPRWMTTPFLRMMGQFRSFSISATLKVLRSGLQRKDAAVVQGAIFGTMFGAVSWALKEMVRGRDPFEKDAEEWLRNAVDRSGMVGIFGDVNAHLERHTNGKVGVSALTGGAPVSRFSARNVVEAYLGASASTAVRLAQVAGAPFLEGGPTQRDLSEARRLVWFNQVFYLRWLFDTAEGKIGENLPEKRQRKRKKKTKLPRL